MLVALENGQMAIQDHAQYLIVYLIVFPALLLLHVANAKIFIILMAVMVALFVAVDWDRVEIQAVAQHAHLIV